MLKKVTDDLVTNAGEPDGQTEDVCGVLIAPYETSACHECRSCIVSTTAPQAAEHRRPDSTAT